MYLLLRFTMLSDRTHVMLLVMVGSSTEIIRTFCLQRKEKKIKYQSSWIKKRQTLQL